MYWTINNNFICESQKKRLEPQKDWIPSVPVLPLSCHYSWLFLHSPAEQSISIADSNQFIFEAMTAPPKTKRFLSFWPRCLVLFFFDRPCWDHARNQEGNRDRDIKSKKGELKSGYFFFLAPPFLGERKRKNLIDDLTSKKNFLFCSLLRFQSLISFFFHVL